ncbi:MAG: tetratricopeptide repeat protein [bacterium]|nr:tetratricopeptide repeat protein [bacterium]
MKFGRQHRILVGIGVIITLLVSKCYCSEYTNVEPDIQFAEYLLEKGDFYQAITEYKRFIFHHQDSPLINYANYKIGLCYKNGNKNELAREFFEKVLDNSPENKLKEKTCFMLTLGHINEGDFEAARFELDELMGYSDSKEEISSEIYYWRGITYLYEYKWGPAQREFNQVTDGKRVKPAKELQPYLEAALHLPYRSPQKALRLSTFLPGSGQIYSGRIIDGLISFVFNSSLVYFTGKKIDSEDYLSAGLIFTFGVMRFYNGNRENACKAAQEYNERINSEMLKKMRLDFGH